MTEYYLLKNQNKVGGRENPDGWYQGRFPRREPFSGVVVLHTSESVTDNSPPDSGAENVAGYISRRPDPGSYQGISDSDSIIWLLPPLTHEAWHVRVDGFNTHSVGLCAAMAAKDWKKDSPYTIAQLRNLAKMGAQVMRQKFGSDAIKYVRRITRDEAMRRVPGFTTHGDLQPSDRSDAWSKHPDREWLWSTFLNFVREELGQKQEGDWFDMATKNDLKEVISQALKENSSAVIVRNPKDGAIYLASGLHKRHLADIKDVNLWKFIGAKDIGDNEWLCNQLVTIK